MTYQDYIQSMDAAWLAAQRRGDVEEEQTLAAILYRLVQPREATLGFLAELLEQTTDPARRMCYEQAIVDIQQCQPEPLERNEEMPKQAIEIKTMHPDGPISAEQLAQLACMLYAEVAPTFGVQDALPWESLTSAQQNCMVAVTRRVLHRVDARVRYLLHVGYTGPLVGETDVTAPVEQGGTPIAGSEAHDGDKASH